MLLVFGYWKRESKETSDFGTVSYLDKRCGIWARNLRTTALKKPPSTFHKHFWWRSVELDRGLIFLLPFFWGHSWSHWQMSYIRNVHYVWACRQRCHECEEWSRRPRVCESREAACYTVACLVHFIHCLGLTVHCNGFMSCTVLKVIEGVKLLLRKDRKVILHL